MNDKYNFHSNRIYALIMTYMYKYNRCRGVEIRKCAFSQESYLKKVTCPYKILLVLFLFKHSILAKTVAGS